MIIDAGGLMFAKKFRSARYVTMLDPFQNAFGQRTGGIFFLPALFGDALWSAAVLAAYGKLFVTYSLVKQVILISQFMLHDVVEVHLNQYWCGTPNFICLDFSKSGI